MGMLFCEQSCCIIATPVYTESGVQEAIWRRKTTDPFL